MGKLDDELYHKQGNVKGSLWGYNHGIPNGKRKAGGIDMNDSILNDIKKLLGIPEDVEDFDRDIIIHINTVFFSINQMGIGPLKCFSIEDKSSKWSDFSDRFDMEALKSYIHLKVKMLFDPPANSQLTESYNNTIKELEFRIHSLWDRYMTSDVQSIKEWVDANER